MSASFNRIFGSDAEPAQQRAQSDHVQSDTASVEIVSGDLGAEQTSHVQPAGQGDAFETSLGPGSSVEGKIVCVGPTRLGGNVSGEIVADSAVLVEEGATINANLTVQEASIGGRVNGNVSATGKISLSPTARIDGDIHTPSLTIDEGAQVKGKIEVSPNAGGAEKVVDAAPRFAPQAHVERSPMAGVETNDDSAQFNG